MEPIEVAAGTALVGAMAGAGWPVARAEVVAFWRRVRPAEADDAATELAEVRAEVLAARQAGDPALERTLADTWQQRLRTLVQGDPTLAADLRNLVDQHLVPALSADERARITGRPPGGDSGPS
ncbi:hypothetical protein GCM10022225_58920 [Plantactinospora mayteni]|uniref:Uncharacterized protein n=1 Tax=Plantactinospora mayteni TaxID=566021 RepID=A0ABQ4EKI7_9ACTN|nr:hypothetical protein [Plantactinospora mayteni]GIG95257.1 hypothetical protein Pma05_18300 [Plantactinospora mayteni]